MDDRSDAPRPQTPRRIELMTGAERRRRWSDALKAQIVAESFEAGAVVAEIARRHDVRAQQVHGWRRDAREGRLALPAKESVAFAPVVVAGCRPGLRAGPAAAALRPLRRAEPFAPMIEIEAGDILVRVCEGADATIVAAMVRALRAPA